jgi:hypothetical protein
MKAHGNYRYLSEGELKVYGNCIQIKEKCFSISRDQERGLIREEVRNTQKNIERRNQLFEHRFQEHVLKYGHQFDNYRVEGFEYLDDLEEPDFDFMPTPPIRERGDIKGFSRASRRRLLIKLNQRNPDDLSAFYHITLTYPKRFPEKGEEHKADIDALIKRMKRRFGEDIEYLWKLEFQKRGAPHYHFIVYLPKVYRVQYLRKWIAKGWYEIAQRFWEEKLENHLTAGTSCDKVQSLRKAGAYLSKYIAKEGDEVPEDQGRFWGCSRNWGEVVLEQVKLTGNQLIHLRRLVKRKLKGNKRMQKITTKPINLVIFGHWSFFTHAIDWVKQMH